MEFTTSKINNSVSYSHEETDQELNKIDANNISELYKIRIFDNNYLIATGVKQSHPGDAQLAYNNVYAIYNKKAVTKVGVFEYNNQETDEPVEIDFEKMDLLLFNVFYKEYHNLMTLSVTDEQIQTEYFKTNDDTEERKEEEKVPEQPDEDREGETKGEEKADDEALPPPPPPVVNRVPVTKAMKTLFNRKVSKNNLMIMYIFITLIKEKNGDVPSIMNEYQESVNVFREIKNDKKDVSIKRYFMNVSENKHPQKDLSLLVYELLNKVKFVYTEGDELVFSHYADEFSIEKIINEAQKRTKGVTDAMTNFIRNFNPTSIVNIEMGEDGNYFLSDKLVQGGILSVSDMDKEQSKQIMTMIKNGNHPYDGSAMLADIKDKHKELNPPLALKKNMKDKMAEMKRKMAEKKAASAAAEDK